MARMIPAEPAPQTRSSAERMLFPVLRDQLDDSCLVFHSFNLLVPGRQGKFIEGEIDFLVFQAETGFLVLEVKGGHISYDGQTGTWQQNGNLMKDPFGQAETAKYKLQAYLNQRLDFNLKCALAHAVCFPDVYTDICQLPPGADPRICITGRQLGETGGRIRGIMQAFTRDWQRPLTPDESHQVCRLLMPCCEYGAGLVDRLGAAESVLFRLTQNQCHLLDFIGRRRRALIEGCAGSGKTVMAVKKARQLAIEGNRVLLLSYNILIGQQLAEAVSDLENVTATNYHRFCLENLKEAGIEPEIEENPEFWQTRVPELMADLIRQNPMKFDAVIVDEGQDFHTEYWLTITEMVKDDGHFYIFYDPDQNLYQTRLDFPISEPPFVLEDNCRNTRQIVERLKPLASGKMGIPDETPEGEPVVERTIPIDSVRRRQLGRILHDLVNNQGIDSRRIVILGGHSMKNTCIGTSGTVGNFRISEAELETPETIRYHTYMKFKGCEADVVILLDVDPDDERWSNPQSMYTAISRARYLLYILYSKGSSLAA